PSSATLSGTVTGVPTGGSPTFTWSKLSGPGTVTFSNANAASTTASFSTAGSYVLRFTANLGAAKDDDDVNITVKPVPNAAPSVNAGPDQTIKLPNNASLNGTVTDDGLPAGATVTITWSKVSGPGTVTFSNPNAASTTASFSQEGNYVLRLTASDTELTAS